MNEWIVRFYRAMNLSVSEADAMVADRSAFEREHRDASDQYWRISHLRGATQLAAELQAMESLLATTRAAVDQAMTSKAIQDARQQLQRFVTDAAEFERKSRAIELAFQQNLAAGPKYFEELKLAKATRELIAAMRGAGEQLAQMETLLVEAPGKIATTDGIVDGYVEALALVSKHREILAAAKVASAQFDAIPLDTLVAQKQEVVKSRLVLHKQVAPPLASKIHEQDLARLVEASRTDAQEALLGMNGLVNAMDDDITALRAAKNEAEQSLAALKILIGELDGMGVPESETKRLTTSAELVETKHLPKRQFELAATASAGSLAIARAMHEHRQQFAEVWAQKAEEVTTIKSRGFEVQVFLPLATSARQLAEAAQAVEALAAKSEFDAADAGLLRLRAQQSDLESRLERMVPDGRAIDTVVEERKAADAEVTASHEQTVQALKPLAEALEAQSVPAKTALHVGTDARIKQWQGFLRGAEAVTKLAETKTATLEAFAAIRKSAADALAPSALPAFVDDAREVAAAAATAARPEKVARLIADLERFEVDIAAEKRRHALVGTLDAEAAAQELVALESELSAKLDEAKLALAEVQAQTKASLAKAEQIIKLVAKKNSKFTAYTDSLSARAADIMALVESDDPDLQQIAKEELAALNAAVTAIGREQPSGSTTFDEVDAKHKQLSKTLGKGNQIKQRLPDTYAELYDALQETFVQARASSPADGLALFLELEPRINAAATEAVTQQGLFDAFESTKKLREQEWTALKRQTRTWITDKTDAYEARFKSRLNEATEVAKQEGKITDATQMLEAIATDLAAISNAADPRAELQRQDVAAQREASAVIDLANQFNKSLETFETTTLPAVERSVKASDDGDLDQLDSLRRTGPRAAAVVRPYLDIVSKWPHKNLLADKAPSLDKARGDFATAQSMLTDAVRVAERMIQNPEGTDVAYTGDLERVARDWAKFSQEYSAAVYDLNASINSFGTDEPDREAKAAGERAQAKLAPIGDHFKATKFAASVGTLCEPRPKGKAERAAAEKSRSAAREVVLRAVRSYRKDIVSDPLIVRINAKANPFKNVQRETSMLHATLKRLELESLGAV